jgi:DNA processing protein
VRDGAEHRGDSDAIRLGATRCRDAEDVSELALAAYAAETGRHVLSESDPGFARFARRFDATRLRACLAAAGLRWIGRSDGCYPPSLEAIFDPPPGLFVRGEAPLELLQRPAVAIVGARACSSYGSHVARMFGRELSDAGLVVVSGMARGVDGEAHRGALEAGGQTVAVLGCGVDRDYPAAHAELARRICRDGLVVSEYAPGVEPAPWRFPARNRIVAGLAQVTVVIEARARSGALITADLALEEGREVFAVPGEITSALSAGTNALLRVGATAATSAADVLETFGLAPREPEPPDLTPAAVAVLGRLRDGPHSADELVRALALDAGAAAAALAELELHGLLTETSGIFRPSVR